MTKYQEIIEQTLKEIRGEAPKMTEKEFESTFVTPETQTVKEARFQSYQSKRKERTTRRQRREQKRVNKWSGVASYQLSVIEDRVERWKRSEEGQWMKKHCLKQYYDTIQEMEGR